MRWAKLLLSVLLEQGLNQRSLAESFRDLQDTSIVWPMTIDCVLSGRLPSGIRHRWRYVDLDGIEGDACELKLRHEKRRSRRQFVGENGILYGIGKPGFDDKANERVEL